MSRRAPGPALKEEHVFTLVDELLAEQQTLSAVEHFSHLHDRDALPAMARHYKALLPAAPPGPGEQYAFEVNLDACTGCKACVSACHSLNGLDGDEAWRDVGLLLGGTRNDAYQQVVTTACHHCADPGCLNGCPVGAYEKEEDTGIVRHLDDQCIGCQYCVLKCPYDVPKYSDRLGIVRKCDMCVGRLREGEAPACVQACPTSAITIRVVKREDLTFTANSSMIPGAFDSSYTKPSTVYRTKKEMPNNTRPANTNALRMEHAHWPLVVMMVLTQMSAGMFSFQALAGFTPTMPVGLFIATAILVLGLSVSVLHLGRPMGAWRFFIGLRTSWMSREILAFSVFAGSASITCAALILGFSSAFVTSLILSSSILGLVAVFTSSMIYVDTHRPYWNASLTHGRFFGTTLSLGASAVAILTMDKRLIVTALIIRTILYAWEQAQVRAALADEACAWHASARVIKHKLSFTTNACDGVYLLFIIMTLSALVTNGTIASMCAFGALLATLASQIMDRYIFFVASMGPRMTGGYKG